MEEQRQKMAKREERTIDEEAPEVPKQAIEFLDLPLVDLMPTIAKYFIPSDLFALRSCSRYCKQLVDDVGFACLGKVDLTDFGCGWSPRYDEEINTSRNAIKHNIMLKCRSAWLFKWDERDERDFCGEMVIKEDVLSKFLEKNPLVEEFKINCFFKYVGQALQPLLHCKNLVVLKMRCIHDVDDEFLRCLSQNNKNLKKIDLIFSYSITPQGIRDFIFQQPHLTSIGLPNIDTEDQEEVIEAVIQSCKNLKTIKLETWENDNLDRLLRRLADCCKKLKTINLRDSERCWKENSALIDYMYSKGINFFWGFYHRAFNDSLNCTCMDY